MSSPTGTPPTSTLSSGCCAGSTPTSRTSTAAPGPATDDPLTGGLGLWTPAPRMRDAGLVSSAVLPVGRSAELALATALVRDLGDGRAGALIVEGEGGIRKTHLVHAL